MAFSYGYRNRCRLAPASTYPRIYLVSSYARRLRRAGLAQGPTVENGASAPIPSKILHSRTASRVSALLRRLLLFASFLSSRFMLVFHRFISRAK